MGIYKKTQEGSVVGRESILSVAELGRIQYKQNGYMFEGRCICDGADRVAVVTNDVDAERIVTCLHALAGIDDPVQYIAVAIGLEGYNDQLRARLSRLEKVAAAAKEIEKDCSLNYPDSICEQGPCSFLKMCKTFAELETP